MSLRAGAAIRDESDRENALVARVRAGDEAAFDALFRAYYRPLCAFLAGYVESLAVAEDLAQDTLARVWEGRTVWHVRVSVRSYLYALARHRALSWLKHQRVVERVEAQALREGRAVAMGEHGGATDARVVAGDMAAAVERVLSELPDGARRAFSLRRDHELSYAEIAEAMGLSVKRVEALLTQAHKALRAALGEFR
jgi:RNA polymerase sigma-70 factor (ECF subfamily)